MSRGRAWQRVGAIVTGLVAGLMEASAMGDVLVEAEAFADLGGWALDQQFMDQMGSPFLLAHGLGKPVRDARTRAHFASAGTYRVWVRTRDWVATWNAPGQPGRFRVLIDGRPLDAEFGSEGAEWHWQDGGRVDVAAGDVEVALHDLTGFEGRCDAILFASEQTGCPPHGGPDLERLRLELLGLPARPEDGGTYDLAVAGGGIAGICTAISAARLGLSVVLIHDRPVLGGNNSSEGKVWLGGDVGKAPFPRVGDVVKELEPKVVEDRGPDAIYEDDKRLAMVAAEPRIALRLGMRVNGVEVTDGRLRAVTGQDIRSARRFRFAARWFADCTGDACVGALAGAAYEVTPGGRMGASNMWRVRDTGSPSAFPRCPWALDLTRAAFPGRDGNVDKLGKWFWESGFDRDPIGELERIRDTNLRAMYGAWDCLKNVQRKLPDHELEWAGFIAAKRESRRLLGDVVLTRDDLLQGRAFPDGCVPTSWSIDLHLPEPKYLAGFEDDPFVSYVSSRFEKYPRPYWIPYRCLYSRNVPNLFMAGRNISVTHEALGTTRVQRTTGMMGEVIGMAAALCRRHNADPRGVFERHFSELQDAMRKGVGRNGSTP